MTFRVLVLGGTAEGRRLTQTLLGQPSPGQPLGQPPPGGPHAGPGPAVDVVYSLAGRVSRPGLPPGARTRIGGFGGPDGLARYLRAERIQAVVDATHPFAERMTAAAAQAAREAGVELLVLRRPGWTPVAGDDWRRVPSLAAAAGELARMGPAAAGRVFLAVGRLGLAAFAGLDRHWFLARSVEPPAPPLPARLHVLLGRGPASLDDELDLLRRHRIDLLVARDSGGPAGAKLAAARALGLPVLMVDRPPLPDGVTAVATVQAAAERIARLAASR